LDWPNSLYLPPLPRRPTAKLSKERDRLQKAIDEMVVARQAADEAEAEMGDTWKRSGGQTDRSPWLRLVITALELEQRLVEPVEVYRMARDELLAADRKAAEDELHNVEADVRSRFPDMPAGTPTPLSALQAEPKWWTARKRISELPGRDDLSVTLRMCREGEARLADELPRFRRMLDGESKRLADAARAREQQIADARARASKHDEEADGQDRRREAVETLLR